MRRNAQHYQNFLLDSTVEQYCRSRIDPHLVEIENIGIQAIVDAVIKPAGINLEVTYLDRSIGTSGEANTISWPGDIEYTTIPTIRLLYRPYVPFHVQVYEYTHYAQRPLRHPVQNR